MPDAVGVEEATVVTVGVWVLVVLGDAVGGITTGVLVLAGPGAGAAARHTTLAWQMEGLAPRLQGWLEVLASRFRQSPALLLAPVLGSRRHRPLSTENLCCRGVKSTEPGMTGASPLPGVAGQILSVEGNPENILAVGVEYTGVRSKA